MTKMDLRAVVALLAAFLAAMVVVPVAEAQTVGTNSFPGSTGAIAFVSERDGNSEIYRIEATDGANRTNLTNNPALDFQPAWQPLPQQQARTRAGPR